MSLDEITAYLHAHIPLSRSLGAVAMRWDGTALALAAPLGPNLNHRSTAFGGSLSAVAILAGWTLLHLALRDRGIEARLVIQRSEVDFDDPIAGDFGATAVLPGDEDWDRFLLTLRRRHRARVRVRGELRGPAGVGGGHEGVYVALTGPALPGR